MSPELLSELAEHRLNPQGRAALRSREEAANGGPLPNCPDPWCGGWIRPAVGDAGARCGGCASSAEQAREGLDEVLTSAAELIDDHGHSMRIGVNPVVLVNRHAAEFISALFSSRDLAGDAFDDWMSEAAPTVRAAWEVYTTPPVEPEPNLETDDGHHDDRGDDRQGRLSDHGPALTVHGTMVLGRLLADRARSIDRISVATCLTTDVVEDELARLERRGLARPCQNTHRQWWRLVEAS